VVAIGIVGYEIGSGQLPQLARHSSQFDQSGPTSGQSQPSDESGKLTASTVPTSSEPRGFDARAIAAKMKLGVELMTYGEVTKARVMFQRVAEAGDGAGAFALAETYDPLVLDGLQLRKGIMPDLALAHTWYERARDLGSTDARDRISRLAQLPQ
jgi:TPR repeat protein